MAFAIIVSYLEKINQEYYKQTGYTLFPNSMEWNYGGLLSSILLDNKMTRDISSFAEVERKLTRLFRGKKVLEVGCRDGGFLYVLKRHGAIVVGTTGGKYLTVAQRNLGEDSIIDSPMEELGNNRILHNFHPNFLFSLNALDKNRWGKGFPASKIIRTVYRITGPSTKVYLTPSLDSGSVVDWSQLQRLRRVWGLRNSERELFSIADWRFRVSRRSRKKISISKKPRIPK